MIYLCASWSKSWGGILIFILFFSQVALLNSTWGIMLNDTKTDLESQLNCCGLLNTTDSRQTFEADVENCRAVSLKFHFIDVFIYIFYYSFLVLLSNFLLQKKAVSGYFIFMFHSSHAKRKTAVSPAGIRCWIMQQRLWRSLGALGSSSASQRWESDSKTLSGCCSKILCLHCCV